MPDIKDCMRAQCPACVKLRRLDAVTFAPEPAEGPPVDKACMHCGDTVANGAKFEWRTGINKVGRGIYAGFVFKSKLDVNSLPTVADTYTTWKSRWADSRLVRLLAESRCKLDTELHTRATPNARFTMPV